MKRGFSLIELLVVVAIIAILVGVAAPYYNDYLKESKRTKALQDIDVLKQAVLLHDSQEDLPYIGQLATGTEYRVGVLGENDFIGLQGKYLTNIPTDPWDKNYKLDPMGCFIYSEGADSSKEDDYIRDYYVKDLALVSVEWTDMNNDRLINKDDKLYFTFNKPLYVSAGSASDYEIFVNGVSTDSAVLAFNYDTSTMATDETNATASVLIAKVLDGNTVKLGVHSISIKEQDTIRQKYQEVWVNREETLANFSSQKRVFTKVKKADDGITPLRYIMRSNPVKIKEKK